MTGDQAGLELDGSVAQATWWMVLCRAGGGVADLGKLMGAWHCAAASSVYYTLADAASCAQKPLLEGRDIALTFASLCCPAVGWPRAHQLQRKIMFQGLCGMIRSSERGQQAHLELRSVQQAPVGGPDVDKHAKVRHLGLRSHTEGSPGESLEPYTHMPQACGLSTGWPEKDHAAGGGCVHDASSKRG